MGALLFFSKVDFSLYQYIDRFLYIGGILFLLVSYLGPNVRGATRWLVIGEFQLQPSELFKPFFLVSIASLMLRYPPTKWRNIIAHAVLFIIPFLIVLKQPDLGSALVYASTWIAIILMAGIPLRYIAGAVVSAIILIPTSYELLWEYQKLRILTFINPLLDPRGAGYNAIQSMIAVGSGKLFGRGFGRGTQSLLQFLPERHTDFIFATFTEEFGFLGALILLAAFFFLLLQIIKLGSSRDSQTLAFLYISGFFMLLLTHVVINIGMNIGVLPITGITLPFVSAGGSSLISLFIGLGICMSASQKQRDYD